MVSFVDVQVPCGQEDPVIRCHLSTVPFPFALGECCRLLAAVLQSCQSRIPPSQIHMSKARQLLFGCKPRGCFWR